ncbi:MAG TPA: ABC transporter permease subunit [Ktedonobacterales bacterium]
MSQIHTPPVAAAPAARLAAPPAFARWIDVVLIAAVIAVAYGVVVAASRWAAPLTPSTRIDLAPSALPLYAGLSTLRMALAYLLALVFSLAYARAAVASRGAERVMLPLLDILQSIPILSFLPGVVLGLVALFPRSNFGLELAAILLIFTSQAWNMAFSFHQSLLTIPKDLREAASIYRLNAWRRFTRLELPFGVIPLVWNSMMSWAGGWFFLMAAEQFTLGAHSFQLPGLGSYLQAAANAGDDGALVLGLVTLIAIIIMLDQLLWRPLIAWADRFKLDQTTAGRAPTSAVLRALRRSELLDWLGTTVARPTNEALDRGIARLLAPRAASAPAPKTMPVAVAVPVPVAAKDPAPGSASGLAPLGGPLAKPAEQQLAPPRPSGMPHPPGMPRLPGRATTARARDIARRSAALAARLRARWSSGRWSPGRVVGALALAVLVVGGVWGSLAALRLLAQLSLADWGLVAVSAGATLLRTLAALAVGVAWTVPAGVAIGLNPRAARIAQPLAQMVASIPATALFPVLLLVLVGLPGGLNLAAVALMLLGTQWYVLFNVIAGAMAIPSELREAAVVYKLRGWRRWRYLILPAIFPALVTGMVTATGGAWNASVVSEYVTFENHTLSTVGLGALIAGAANTGHFALLLAATLTMAGIVVAGNRLVWRRLYRLAERRFRLD